MIGNVHCRTSQFSKTASNLYGRMVDAICDKSHEIAARRSPAGKDPIVVNRDDVVAALRVVAQLYEIYAPPQPPEE